MLLSRFLIIVSKQFIMTIPFVLSSSFYWTFRQVWEATTKMNNTIDPLLFFESEYR